MKGVVLGLIAPVALSLVVASVALAAGHSASRPAAVGIAHTGLGRVIVDARGRTLYLFEKDRHGRSACSATCAAYWPPLLTSGTPIATQGAKRTLLGTIRRTDGSHQVTFAGHPLYLFSGDTNRGQTNGEGLRDFGASWYVLAPSGRKIDNDG